MLNLCSIYPYSTFLSQKYLFSSTVRLTLDQNSQVRITVQLSNKMRDLSITNNMKSENVCIQCQVDFMYLLIAHLPNLVNVYTWQMQQTYVNLTKYSKFTNTCFIADCSWPGYSCDSYHYHCHHNESDNDHCCQFCSSCQLALLMTPEMYYLLLKLFLIGLICL